MLMTQRFVQLAQADAAPSAILSSARNHNFRDFGFRGWSHGHKQPRSFRQIGRMLWLARRQNRCGYQARRKFVT